MSDEDDNNTNPFRFEILAKDKSSNARVGKLKTPHGDILTPFLTEVITSDKDTVFFVSGVAKPKKRTNAVKSKNP